MILDDRGSGALAEVVGVVLRHAQAAQEFFAATLRELDFVAQSFMHLSQRSCSSEQVRRLLHALLPDPKRPRNSDQNPGLLKAWERKVAEVKAARDAIFELRETGKGMQMNGSRGTFWGL